MHTGVLMRKNWCLAAVLTVAALSAVRPVHGAQIAIEQSGRAEAWSGIVSLVKNEQLEAAYQLALRHKDDGDPRIWAFLGDCLSYGRGVKPDHGQALEYYRKASERIPYAKYRIGLFYAVGMAVPCDKDKAVELMDEALAAGYRPTPRLVQQTHVLLRTRLSEYADPKLKLRFPSRSPKFELSWSQRYLNHKVLGYSLRYGGSGEWLDLYVYDRGWGVIPNGISELSARDLRDAEEAVLAGVKNGTYKNFRDRIENLRGALPLSKLEYSWFSFTYDPAGVKDLRSVIVVFGARGKFFKIRYSGKVEDGEPPTRLPAMVVDFLNRLDAALIEN